MRRTLAERLAEPGLRLRALSVPAQLSLVVLVLLVLACLLAPVIASHDPFLTTVPAQPPGPDAWFGTDAIGRDVFARVLYGGRYSLLIGILATLVALIAAAVLGSIAATGNKAVAEVLMRILDIVMSFPGIALAAVFVAVWGRSLPVLIFAIAFLYTPQLTRVVRANVLAQFGEDYVAASKVMGFTVCVLAMRPSSCGSLGPAMSPVVPSVSPVVVSPPPSPRSARLRGAIWNWSKL